MNEQENNDPGEDYGKISPLFHQELERLSGTFLQTDRYPKDPLRLVVRNQLVIDFKQPSLSNNDEVILSGIDARKEQFVSGIKAIVRRVSHCNPNLVLLEGDEIHLLEGNIDVEYSPGRDRPPPEVENSSANDVHYSPGRDRPPPDVVASSGGSGSLLASRYTSFDRQLRRILADSHRWKKFPIVAVMDTGIDFAFPNTATIPIQHNGGHPMCDTVEPDYIGWDFVNDQNDPYDDDLRNKHGSRIAAIISRAMNHRVKILPLKVLSNTGVGLLFDIFCGFEYLLSARLPEKPVVINASWGFYSGVENALLTSYVRRIRDKGMWLVNAAGNRGDINHDGSNVSIDDNTRYPACYSNRHFNVMTITTIRKDPFEAVENYSPTFVNSGVQGDDNDGGFPESLVDNNALPKIVGSSYATPYASAFVAMKYKKPYYKTTRRFLVEHFPNGQPIYDLKKAIEDGFITVP